jgi:hypothetical protein
MSEWMVIDITAFTKTTNAEKVKKILKTVRYFLFTQISQFENKQCWQIGAFLSGLSPTFDKIGSGPDPNSDKNVSGADATTSWQPCPNHI